MATPKKTIAYEFFVSLVNTLNPQNFISSPTISGGDFQISKDGGSFVDLETTPVVEPAASINVKINLSSTEMNADKIVVTGIDAAGNQWEPITIFIDVPVATIDDVSVRTILLEKIARNKLTTNPATGEFTLFDDDGVAVLLSGILHEDFAETQIYRGIGAEVRSRLT